MAKSSKGSSNSGRSAPRGSSSTPSQAPKPSTPQQRGLTVPAHIYRGSGSR